VGIDFSLRVNVADAPKRFESFAFDSREPALASVFSVFFFFYIRHVALWNQGGMSLGNLQQKVSLRLTGRHMIPFQLASRQAQIHSFRTQISTNVST
jgi:hypothetical protein